MRSRASRRMDNRKERAYRLNAKQGGSSESPFFCISGMCSVQLGRTRHIRKKLHFTDECHQMMVLIRKRAHFTDAPPPSLSRHRVFSRKGCVAARGASQFRKFCSRYRVFDRKRCVAGRESCLMSGNLFAIQGFQLKRVCRGKNKKSQENRKRKYQRRRKSKDNPRIRIAF